MQRNWIGRSEGAHVDFDVEVTDTSTSAEDADDAFVTVFTTRPDTLHGATYMVLAPEHPLVDQITPPSHRETIEAYRTECAAKSDRERMSDAKKKTGSFTGAFAINPANKQRIPIYIADYVLIGYGTGAIMAVPAHDDRDFEFAKAFELPIRAVVMPPDAWLKENWTGSDAVRELRAEYLRNAGEFAKAFTGAGDAVQSPGLDGLGTAQAKSKMIEQLEEAGDGRGAITYKLRDWLFSRQRYWGEPFPILLDSQGYAHAVKESELPVTLPEMSDFKPTGTPEPPLSKVTDWVRVTRDGQNLTRETNTMPQWAGSCWYYLRFIDPKNTERFVDPVKEKYWMPIDLYVGGVEHAVLHLLYARFWHKVLFDLNHVSTPEPFRRLVNQGLILGGQEYTAFWDGQTPISLSDVRDIEEEDVEGKPTMIGVHRQTGKKLVGTLTPEDQIEKKGEGYVLKAQPTIRVDARAFKMSKSRGNVVNPDDIVTDYGADCFRLYEMYMGPLEQQKPWNTRDIVGMSRFLNSVWRHLIGDDELNPGKTRVTDGAIPEALDRQMHRAIKKVGEDIESLRFNTAIAELIKLNNELTALPTIPRELAENLALMLAPLAPHIAEEIWSRLGHERSLARRPWPTFDPAKLVETTMELPVQVNGKLRDKLRVPADADEATILQAAEAAPDIQPWITGKTIKKRIYVPKKLVNLVVG
jgi:leucyl-tRNA synthetase